MTSHTYTPIQGTEIIILIQANFIIKAKFFLFVYQMYRIIFIIKYIFIKNNNYMLIVSYKVNESNKNFEYNIK